MKNNIALAVVGGAVSALIGAAIWAVVTVSTGYQIGWMAVGVGFLVGMAVRFLGQGQTQAFGIVGAAFALLGCVMGNVLSGIGFIAQEYEMGYMEALANFNFGATFDLLAAMFSPMDLLFYAIAVYEGFKFGIIADEGMLTEEQEI